MGISYYILVILTKNVNLIEGITSFFTNSNGITYGIEQVFAV